VRLAAQLERQRRPGCMQALGGDRHAEREVVACGTFLEIVAALVTAPVQQHLARAYPAFEQDPVLAVAGCVHVALRHCRTDADVGGFVAQTGGVGAQLAGALQGYRLGVEVAHVQHPPEQWQQRGRIAQGAGEFAYRNAVRAKVLQVVDLETGGEGHGVRHRRGCIVQDSCTWYGTAP